MLDLLIEIAVQVLLEILAEVLFELGLGSIAESLRNKRKANPILVHLGILLLGALVGWLTTLIISERILGDPPVKGIGFVLSPLAVGMAMATYGKWRKNRGHPVSSLATFWGGATFALSFTAVRWFMLEGLI